MASLNINASLRIWHRLSALILGSFLTLHMANHIAGLAGQAQHIAFMQEIRPYYRNPIAEVMLLSLLMFQSGSGIAMVVRGWQHRVGGIAWLQALSGLYLAIFLLIHVFSVLAGRWFLGLDTNFNFASAGFYIGARWLFFAPYYFLAITSLFTHAGCAAYWNLAKKRPVIANRLLTLCIVSGAGLALAIVLALAGKLYPVTIPATYLAHPTQEPTR